MIYNRNGRHRIIIQDPLACQANETKRTVQPSRHDMLLHEIVLDERAPDF